MQNIKSKTRKQNGGSGKHSGRPSISNKNKNNNNNLQHRLIELKLPDVPVSHTTPIPKQFILVDVQHYINEITRKQIPQRGRVDENTEQVILFNLLKLKNIKDNFSSLESLYACIDILINLVNDKIIQLSKLMPEHYSRMSKVTVSDVSKVIKAWIEFFMNLKIIVLEKEKDKIQKLL